jgi:hypothetical protein
VTEAATILWQITSALDRIGGREHDGLDAGAALLSFAQAADLFSRSSRLNGALWRALEPSLGADTVERLAEDVPTYPELGGDPAFEEQYRRPHP